jgi:methylenetetrahydrofolate reductase (NADPH)
MAESHLPQLSSPRTEKSSTTVPVQLSIEVFPPAASSGIDALAGSVSRMMRLRPAFVSVTYGAGGSTRERSLAVVSRLMAQTKGRTAAHVTCVACPRHETDRVIDGFIATGVERFVALRGDVPALGAAPDGYEDAVTLVRALRRRGIADISVAAYPEVHPKAASAGADIDVLKAKCDAGATRAITQFFLDNAGFHRFRERVAHVGLGIPVVPGVLLFEDFSRAASFARRCGTRVPDHVARRFARHEACPASLRAETRRFLAEQIADLLKSGVEHIHLYTLNRSDLALDLFGGLDLFSQRPAPKAAAA